MSVITLRQAAPGDLPAITTLFRDTIQTINARDYDATQIAVWSAGYAHTDRWEARLSTQHFLVAVLEDKIVGLGSITSQGYLDLLYVHKDHQGQGIGKKLIGALVEFADNRNVGIVYSEVSITARLAFEKAGFTVVKKQEKPHHGVVFINYLMEKNLAPILIETPRLAMRRMVLDDAPHMFELNNDPEVIKYTGDPPFADLAATVAFVISYHPYRATGMGRWTVLDKATGEYLGWCGLKYLPELDEVDLGYRFHRRHWGKGYATESAQACMQYGFETLGLQRIIGRAMKENLASIRVLEKVGMVFWKDDNFDEHPGACYVSDRTPIRLGVDRTGVRSNIRSYEYYRSLFQGKSFPLAFVDRDTFDANIKSIAARAGDKKVRVATKSLRSIDAINRILDYGPPFSGLMTYHPEETLWLHSLGFRDLLIAYPVVNPDALTKICRAVMEGAAITCMVDCGEHIELLNGIAAQEGVILPVCLDLDVSSDFGPLHFGVWRSPLHSAEEVNTIAQTMKGASNLRLVGLMAYEAQIAGIGERLPGQWARNKVLGWLKRISARQVASRRQVALKALSDEGFSLAFVNAGGTGSMETSREEPWVTEITAGSGFYNSHLFDYYPNFRHEAAAGFALEIVRRPKEGIFTCFGGGYIASGATGREKQPLPWLPSGARISNLEGAGEVQTPVLYDGPEQLQIGDPIFFRHAKAGELCVHFDRLFVVSEGKMITEWPTYSGQSIW